MSSGALRLGRVLRLAPLLAMFCSSAGAATLCPMCYTTAATAARSTVQALRSGTFMLAIPPVLLFSGLMAVAWRWKNASSEEDQVHSAERDQ